MVIKFDDDDDADDIDDDNDDDGIYTTVCMSCTFPFICKACLNNFSSVV